MRKEHAALGHSDRPHQGGHVPRRGHPLSQHVVRLRVEANRVKCQVCLEGANTREGDVNRYRNDESGLIPGNYHHACALKVGYNDWDEE
jgi:hypothetical protein